jgi:hypothetical protein
MHIEFGALLERVDGHGFWLSYLRQAAVSANLVGIHLAIFSDPFLSLVLAGRKTVESRFSRNRQAPFGEIRVGDVILIKQKAGPIRGLALAKQVLFYDLTAQSLARIRQWYGDALGVDEAFWASRSHSAYATIIELAEAAAIDPLSCDKRDRRGWVSLRSRQLALAL